MLIKLCAIINNIITINKSYLTLIEKPSFNNFYFTVNKPQQY